MMRISLFPNSMAARSLAISSSAGWIAGHDCTYRLPVVPIDRLTRPLRIT